VERGVWKHTSSVDLEGHDLPSRVQFADDQTVLPTGTLAVTVLVTPSITDTVFDGAGLVASDVRWQLAVWQSARQPVPRGEGQVAEAAAGRVKEGVGHGWGHGDHRGLASTGRGQVRAVTEHDLDLGQVGESG
jgi:hypothetical protein